MITLSEGWYLNALSVAMRLHNGRIDASGQPRWFHLQQTAFQLVQRWPDASRAEVEAAVLHDVLEAGTERHMLRQLHIAPASIDLVEACTPSPPLPYLDWIRAAAAARDESVLRVLIADCMDRADLQRPYPAQVRDTARAALFLLEPALHRAAA